MISTSATSGVPDRRAPARRVRRSVLAVGAGVVLLASAACSGGATDGAAPPADEGPVTLTFLNWASSEEATAENMKRVIAAFEDEHPDIDIDNVAVPFNQVRQQALTQFSAGDAPDVMQLNQNVPFELAAEGLLLDLEASDLADPAWQGAHFASAVDASRYEGQLIAAPWILAPYGLWYDKDVLQRAGLDPDAPPRTFEELRAQMQTVKEELGDEGVYPIAIDTTNVDNALFQYLNYFLAFGARPLYDGAANFDTPEVVQALSFLQEMVEQDYTPVGQDIRQLRELQANGRVAFRMDGPFVAGILRSLNPALEGEAFHQRFGVTGIPQGPAGDNGPVFNGHQLAIAADSENPQAAWTFVEYLIDSEVSIQEYQLPQGVIPANQQAAESPSAAEALSPQISGTYLERIIPAMQEAPYGPAYAEATSIVLEAMQRVAISGEDPAAVAEQTQSRLEPLFGGS